MEARVAVRAGWAEEVEVGVVAAAVAAAESGRASASGGGPAELGWRVSVRRAGRELRTERLAEGRCTQAGQSAAALAAGVYSPGLREAVVLTKAAAALVDGDCRPALSPWAAGWNTAVTPAGGTPFQRAAGNRELGGYWVARPGL